jgi:hypothetical protein
MSLLSMAFYVTQLNTLLESVVDLVPHSGTIQIGFGGKLLEFVNALAIIRVPKFPPNYTAKAKPWVV